MYLFQNICYFEITISNMLMTFKYPFQPFIHNIRFKLFL